jgi:hypothetical protein
MRHNSLLHATTGTERYNFQLKFVPIEINRTPILHP